MSLRKNIKKLKSEDLNKTTQTKSKTQPSNLTEGIIQLSKDLGEKLIVEGAIAQVDLPMEIVTVVDSGSLPKYLVIGSGLEATTYTYAGSTSKSLFELMTADKGVIGKILYKQNNERSLKMPEEIELQIMKTVYSKKTCLVVGGINTSN